MNLFDSSALLAFLGAEPGMDVVQNQLERGGGSCGAVNWSEVAQKTRWAGRDWRMARAILLGFGVAVEPVHGDDAERAAELWSPGSQLSLADRLCLALGERLDAEIWTADSAWGTKGRVHQIR